MSHLALLGMGAAYGLTPCAPLLAIAAYAATLPVMPAALLGSVFTLASALSPGLLFLALSGSLARRMREEIPEYLSWLRLGSDVLLIILPTIHLFKEVLS